MTCKICGVEIEAGKFCPACGALLTDEHATPASEELAEESVVEQPAEEAVIKKTAKASKRNPGAKKGTIALIMSILILVLNFVGCCIPFGSIITFIGSIVGIVIASSAIKASKAVNMGNIKAKIAIALSAISLVLTVVLPIVCLILGVGGGILGVLAGHLFYISGY